MRTIPVLIFSLAFSGSIFSQDQPVPYEDEATSEEAKKKNAELVGSSPLVIGIRGGFGVSVRKDMPSLLHYTNGATHFSAGLMLALNLGRYVTLDTGGSYRFVGLGFMYEDFEFHEWHLPVTILFHFNSGPRTSTFFGGGIAYNHEFRGRAVATIGSAPPFDLPAADLHSGLGYLIKAGMRQNNLFSSHHVYGQYEFGFEYAERGLQTITKELFFNVGFGYAI